MSSSRSPLTIFAALALAATTSAFQGFPADNMSLYAQMTMGELGYPLASGSDCWGYTSPSGREYALMGSTQGVSVVEISDPVAPVLIGTIDGPNGLWRDIRTFGTRAYAVSENGGGIQVLDLTNVDLGVVILENTVTGNGSDATHNLAVDEVSGFLYRIGGGGNGLRIFSLANPSAPAFVGQWNSQSLHDAEIVTYTTGPLAGREIAYCSAGSQGLTILDVTNKSNISILSLSTYNGLRYAHQGWLSADRSRFYLGDELDEGNTVSVTTTYVFDVVDPANPSYIGAFDNGNPAIGHNMFGRDGFLFQANYTSGLRVFDLNQNPDSPPEVGYFDTAPGTSATSFDGLWGCFVDFPSGSVIGSDQTGGLFVLRFGPAPIEISLVAAPPLALDPAGDTVDVVVAELVPGSLDPASPRLVYKIGTLPVSVPLVSNGGTSYTAVFPSIVCGVGVDWYVAADPLIGPAVTAPAGAPATTFESVTAASLTVARADDMETAAGWFSGAVGDNATGGVWTRADPIGTIAQPDDDNSALGTRCWFTGQASPGAPPDSNDVDGGRTTLLTPILDMTGLDDPRIAYFRWYSNDQGGAPNSDVFEIEISDNGGANWTLVERVGPGGPGTAGGWIPHSFRLGEFVSPTNQVRMRFVAMDLGTDSTIEAAIDDFSVTDANCGDGIGTIYCLATPNSTGSFSTIVGSGSAVVSQNNLVLTATGLPSDANGYFIVSRNPTFVINPGGSQGILCVGSNTGRYFGQIGNSGATGQIGLTVDNAAIPQATGTVAAVPGDIFYFQCWHRDANPGPTSNMTRGYWVLFL